MDLSTLYDDYTRYVTVRSVDRVLCAASGDGTCTEHPRLLELKASLEARLMKAGIPNGIPGFERLIDSNVKDFEDKTLTTRASPGA